MSSAPFFCTCMGQSQSQYLQSPDYSLAPEVVCLEPMWQFLIHHVRNKSQTCLTVEMASLFGVFSVFPSWCAQLLAFPEVLWFDRQPPSFGLKKSHTTATVHCSSNTAAVTSFTGKRLESCCSAPFSLNTPGEHRRKLLLLFPTLVLPDVVCGVFVL